MTRQLLPGIIAALLLVPLASAALPAYDFYGNVTIGTNTSTDGATVSAWANDNAVAVAFVAGRGQQPGVPAGQYLMHIPGTVADGTNVTFKIWDISVASAVLNQTPSRELYLATPDRANPTFTNNQSNDTGVGYYVKFAVNVSDETGLSSYIFSFNNGTGAYTNDSAVSLSGTSSWVNVTKVVNTTVGSVINALAYFNDSSGNWNASNVSIFATTERTAPTFTNNQSNDTGVGYYVKFAVNFSDTTGLSAYIFSFNNGNGSYINDSSVALSGTSSWVNVTKTVNSTVGSVINALVYVNDSHGTWNASNVSIFATTAVPTIASTPSTGGGGAAAGGGGGAAATTPTQTVTITATANVPVAAAFTATDLDVTKIEVTTTTSTSATVTATEATAPPAGVPAPSGSVSTYLQLSTTAPAGTVSSVTVTFKVSKSWASANGIDISTVTLQRYASNAWNALPTTLVNQDSSFYYFTAVSPGFSTFAIVAQKQAVAPGKLCVPASKRCDGSELQQCSADGSAWSALESCGYGCDATALACNPAPAPAPPAEEKPTAPPLVIDPLLIIAGAIIVLIAIAAAFALSRRKKRGRFPHRN